MTLTPISFRRESREVVLLDLSQVSHRRTFHTQVVREAVGQGAQQVVQSLDEWLATPTPERDPGAFIFFLGRCGSSLLINMINEHPDATAIAEPVALNGLVREVLTHPDDFATSALRTVIRRLTASVEGNVVIKPTSWVIAAAPLIAEQFPGSRLVFLGRDRAAVVASCLQSPPRWSGMREAPPVELFPTLNGKPVPESEFYAAAWESGQAFAAQLPRDRTLLLDYEHDLQRDLPGATRRLLEHIGLAADDRTLEDMLAVSARHAKRPDLPWPSSAAESPRHGTPVRDGSRSQATEEPLEGGNTHTSIVRVDDTVRRPTGPWTPGVHALLRHLAARDFRAAPRVHGIDEQGREILSYIQGVVVWPEAPDLVASTDALFEIGALIRELHAAVAGFTPPPCEWSDLASDPSGEHEILCHNDLGPWNLIRSNIGWVFIDWDLAAPGRRAWDLAWAALSLIPFFPNRLPDPIDLEQRLTAFCNGYGHEAVPPDLIQVAFERANHEATLIRERGARGIEPHARLLREGHGDLWNATAACIRSHEQAWTEIVKRITAL